MDLFGVPWAQVELDQVKAFLADAEEEGVTWEAKADGEDSPLHPGSIRKAACGLANQIGGHLLLGVHRSKERGWELPGITVPAEEPKLWVGQILRGLRPVPRFDVKSWAVTAERIVAVAQIEPVAEPPCITPDGRVYERVSGETLPVKDPALLDRLFRRGVEARATAARRGPVAAGRALDASGWSFQRSIGLSVALAPIARESDDISSRLFVQSTRNAIVQATWTLLSILNEGGNPDGVEQNQRQDSHAALLHFAEQRHFGDDNEVVSTNRSTWLTQANWDGTVAASLTLSDGNVMWAPQPEVMIEALWRPIIPIAARLGGYGPTQLTVMVGVTKTRESVVQGQVAHAPGRPPPDSSLYSRLGETTQMDRVVDLSEPDEAVVAGLGRELRRAAGEIEDEPEGESGPDGE
jgi:hypothetical protein